MIGVENFYNIRDQLKYEFCDENRCKSIEDHAMKSSQYRTLWKTPIKKPFNMIKFSLI